MLQRADVVPAPAEPQVDPAEPQVDPAEPQVDPAQVQPVDLQQARRQPEKRPAAEVVLGADAAALVGDAVAAEICNP